MATKEVPPCPNCGGKNGLPIVYGLPSKDVLERAQRGEVILGGCFVTEEHPQWRCRDCGHEWRTADRAVRL